MTHDFFDKVDRLRLPLEQFQMRSEASLEGISRFPKGRRIKGEFLKGPIPLAWLSIASKLPGKAPLAVALSIMFEVGRRKQTEIVLTSAICERFGVNRKSKYRGLHALEDVGLVSVERRPRKNPIVTVLEPHSQTSPTSGTEILERTITCRKDGSNSKNSTA